MGDVTEEGGTWTIKTSTTLKTMELKFKLGEEFDETTPDGREVRATVTFEDGKIVCVQKAKKEGQKSTRVSICCIAITRWTKMTNSFFRTELELFSVTFFPFSV